MPPSPPPLKIPFSQRREREFLYLSEVDALIAACQKTRSPIRNQALVMLLFCQALQPAEICWLRWCDFNFTTNTLLVTRNRSLSTRIQPQVVVNLQPLCQAEIEQLQQLEQLRCTDWLFASERRQRLSARSLHHIVQQAGEAAGLPIPVHPYMLRRSGLYYRAALLLAKAQLSLRECCLLWNYHATSVPLSASAQKEYCTIERKREEVFLHTLERLKAFTGIAALENLIDYVLGAYSLFPQLTELPHNYWLAPLRWHH